MTIIPDTVSNNLFHFVVPGGVYTVSTNALFVADKQLQESVNEYMEIPEKRTVAWATLVVTPKPASHNPSCIRGVTVWSTPQLGHGMSVHMADGSRTNLHVTHHQYLYEMQQLLQDMSTATTSKEDGSVSARKAAALEELEKTPPFARTIQPLIHQIQLGLQKMTQLTGSSTTYKTMTTQDLAAAVYIKDQCEQHLYIPLLELIELTRRRKKSLRAMIASQQDQLRVLARDKTTLEESRTRMMERLEVAASNMRTLVDRSAYIRTSVTDTGPTMTQAEQDFCQEMALFHTKLSYWESKVKEVTDKAKASLVESSDGDTADDNNSIPATGIVSDKYSVSDKEWEQVATLERYTHDVLNDIGKRLYQAETKLHRLATQSGVQLSTSYTTTTSSVTGTA
jgi:hypothetical protein